MKNVLRTGLFAASAGAILPLIVNCSGQPAAVKRKIAAEAKTNVQLPAESNGGDSTIQPGTPPNTQTVPPDPISSVGVPVLPTPPSEINPPDPSTEGDGDFILNATYTVAPETLEPAPKLRGSWIKFSMKASDSKIFKGTDSYLKPMNPDFVRDSWLYLPVGYDGISELPFMVVGDGGWATHQEILRNSIDNLIHAKKIPPMALILVNPGTNDPAQGPNSQRSWEYDSVNDSFVTWIETEVIPRITKDYNVKLTNDPEGRAAMGGSSSGAMAFTMAWFRPDLYHRVYTYSGTFVNRITTPEHPYGAWDYPSFLIKDSEKKPIRVVLEAGENDNLITARIYNDWLLANRTMAQVLKAKGYHYRFQYAPGAKHIDRRVQAQEMPNNLIWLWRGYPIPK
ncbi:MAG: hypothetical protein EOP07_09790 [Proteobacteria bacterium]|nr:MAG: hypothetical protein EOP07_09790 [Pseudomonadota bacterium]